MERGPDGQTSESVEIIERSSIQRAVSEELKKTAMEVVCACLRHQIYLPAGAGTMLSSVQHRTDPVFGNGLLGDLQASC